MGQIVKKKKKGRPAKADLSARDQETPERDLRRSLRRRNVKYVFDLDDYFDEDELFADDEDQRRREKKLKLLLKLQSGDEPESTASRERHALSTSASSADEDGKPLKKRKIDEEMNEDLDEDNDEVNEEDNYNYEDDEEVRKTKPENKDEDSPPGTLAEASWLPLPDKKTLELILDKLQRKDIYGVYAEPVDPEELPDYHDVIDQPMDFATVRNKLRNGSYATFEQFESDVFLICSNAMQYNAPDTIYHKQARTIQELAKRKFHKIRLKVDRTEKDIKPELKTRFGSIPKKQIKRSGSQTVQEPVGSDFSSGATLATTGDIQNVPHTLQPFVSDKTSGMDGLVERSSFLNENNLDKVEESLPGKGPLSRFGRRLFVQDENRRATYSISFSLPVASSESIFSTFDGETKQLVPVGLYSDHSYARSLARFAATLGSVAWKVASKRIEQALPQGFKFGHGWVGEYEPLPTPVLMLENCSVKEPPFFSKVQPAAAPKNIEKIPIIADSSKESPRNVPFLEQKLPFLGAAGIRPPSASVMTAQPIRPNISEMNASFCLSPRIKSGGPHNLNYHNQTLQSRAFLESDKKSLKQVELNSPPSSSNNTASSVGNKQLPKSSEMETSKPTEFSSKSFNFSRSGSFKQPDHSNGVSFGGLPNGKIVNNRIDGGHTTANLSSDLVKPANYYPHEQGHPGQGLSDPVQMMRKLTENAHNQQKPSNQSPDDTNNAAAAAARAWMSVGAGGLRPVAETLNPNKNQMYSGPPYNSVQSQVPQFRGEFPNSGSPMHAFVPQGAIPMRVGNQVQFQNQRMVFPQLTTADLSRFQVQSNWRNVSPQMHSRQKQESLPPDLNIGFQSSGSPGRPSSGVLVDSQQPDLALQL